MHLGRTGSGRRGSSFPRRRGDAPGRGDDLADETKFPPQARGCTADLVSGADGPWVSPAGAGMHPQGALGRPELRGFPRRRGDAPSTRSDGREMMSFPPQARGCTCRPDGGPRPVVVSPAGAGMHPWCPRCRKRRKGFPRRRGDAPAGRSDRRRRPGFPPQARGCTCGYLLGAGRVIVSPAGAGMHRRPTCSETRP